MEQLETEIINRDAVSLTLKLVLPIETTNKNLQQIIQYYNSRVKLKGFRPGKAPDDMIIKLFNSSITEQFTRNFLLPQVSQSAEKMGIQPDTIQKLYILDMPSVQEIYFENKNEIKVKIDLPPKVTKLADYKNNTFYNPVRKIDKVDVDTKIKSMLYKYADYGEKRENVENETNIKIQMQLYKNNKFIRYLFGSPAAILLVDKELREEDYIKYYSARKTGDTWKEKMKFILPDKNEVEFEVLFKIEEIREVKLPQEEVLKEELKVDSPDKIRKEVRKIVEEEVKDEEREYIRRFIFSWLIKHSEIKLPQSAWEEIIEDVIKGNNLSEEHFYLNIFSPKKAFKYLFLQRIYRYMKPLIINEIAEKEKIEPDKETVEKNKERLIKYYGKEWEQYSEIEKEVIEEAARRSALEDKVTEFLLNENKIKKGKKINYREIITIYDILDDMVKEGE